jgi:nucleotide-binding universal stress UspA family protein
MVDIRKILCAVDYSAISRSALDHAVTLGRWYDARVTALHVRSMPRLPMPPVLFAEAAPGGIATALAPTPADTEADLRAWVKAADVDVAVVDGAPASAILEHAARLPADLLVMGTHGRGGFERLILGSVAETVLRRASCPVLTVPPPGVATSRLPYKRLLCAVDFSEASVAALRFALSIAQESDARLAILHVFEQPPGDDLPALDADVMHAVAAEVRSKLEALVPPDARNWCDPSPAIAYGRPYRKILELATEEQADLIVMGVRGRNAVDLTMFGSTTNHVIRHALCPVLTLRV